MKNTFLRQDVSLDIMKKRVGTVLISEWILSDFKEQIIAADITIEGWLSATIPEEFLSLNAFVCQNNTSILYYAQWESDEAHEAFVRKHRPKLVKGIDTKLSNVIRTGLVRYRLIYAPNKEKSLSLISGKCLFDIISLQLEEEANLNDYIEIFSSGYIHISIDKKQLIVFIPSHFNEKYLNGAFGHIYETEIKQYYLYRSISR